MRIAILMCLALGALACGSDETVALPATDNDVATTGSDTAPDTATAPDPDAQADTAQADTDQPGPDPNEPGPLRVGVGRARIPAPVGIGTAGFSPFVPDDGVESRYSEEFPATVGIYTHPTFHVVAVEGPVQTIVFLRADTMGISMEIRNAIIARVVELGGPDLAQGLLIGATHTHSGPGRLVDHLLIEAGFDTFHPPFFRRLVDVAAKTIIEALDDLEPARFGYTMANTDAIHQDRRCESPDILDGTLPVLRFDRADGTVKALVMSYSVHGTMINIDSRRLSRDIHGGVELKIEEQFDHPVTALFFNSWSADTSPSAPGVDEGYQIPNDYNRIEAAGNVVAEVIMAVIEDIETSETAAVRGGVANLEFALDTMGYAEGEFGFGYGGAYCGIGVNAVCFGEGEPPDSKALDGACIPFGEDFPAPQVTTVGMLRLGDLWISTLPAEPGTEIGTTAVGTIQDTHGLKDVMLVGYAQDYVGYHLTEDDWFLGGYETSGAIWGPKQGDYVNKHLIDFAAHFVGDAPLSWEPPAPRPAYILDPQEVLLVPETSAVPAGVITEPDATYAAGDTVLVVVAG
ncbi:MAG: neutral ceramidase, partial [Myxococcota bacterium]